jgi:hypothetical protein
LGFQQLRLLITVSHVLGDCLLQFLSTLAFNPVVAPTAIKQYECQIWFRYL